MGIHIESILRGLLGIFFLISICYALSSNRKAIDWKLVFTGIFLQIIFGILVTKVHFVYIFFEFIANGFTKVTEFTKAGANFVLGDWPNVAQINQLVFDAKGAHPEPFTVGYIFAFKVLPTIIFFSALSSLLYYLGILQKVVMGVAWVMSKTMRLSGAESLAAAGNIFLGQTEAPLLVKPFIPKMTKSELLCLMTGGMATIAGGVLAAYIGFLGGDDKTEQLKFAMHLLSASIMSAPAAIVASKIIFPETEPDKIVTKLELNKEQVGSNMLESITIGTGDGLKLAVNVGAMLLVFTALIAMVDAIFGDLIGKIHFGKYATLNEHISIWTNGKYDTFSLRAIFGVIFAPLAWLIGTPSKDMMAIGQLLGEKTIINEFFAYGTLGSMKMNNVISDPKSIIIATYALCGFSNISSIGIQIGGIGAMATNQRTNLAALGIKALIGGSVACFLTAAVIGMLY